jgi:predicted dehydrogenase
MGDNTRIGIIGVGQIGKIHIQRYQAIEGVQIVALADVNEVEAKRVSEEYGIRHMYTDLRELLERDDVEAVDVCLHNNLHMPATVAALEAGKHVFCEKPMAGAYCDAERMYCTAQEMDRKLSIQLATLFSSETKAARALIDQGMLGDRYHARSAGSRRRGRPYVDGYGSAAFVQRRNCAGGALYDAGVYNIARMLYLLDNPQVLRITGQTYQKTEMDAERREASGYNVEELGLGLVRLAGGITLDVVEAWAAHLDQLGGSYVLGTMGGLRLEPFGFYRSAGDLDLDATVNLKSFETRVHRLREHAEAFDSPQQHWIAGLRGRVELLPTAELALNTMLISEGIYLSNRLGREVTAEEVKASSRSTSVVL